MGRKSTADLEAEIKKVKGLELHGKALRLNFSYRGQRCRETLQIPITSKNIEYAKGLLATVKHQIKTRVFSYAEHFPDSPNVTRFGHVDTQTTVAQVAAKWFTSKVELTTPVRRRYQTVLDRIEQTIGDHKVGGLLKSQIEEYRNNLILDLSPSTANYHTNVLRQVLTYAKDNKFIEEDAAKWLKRFKVDKVAPDPLTVEEFDAIVTKGCLSDFDRNWYTTAVWTGVRTGELCALAWEDINLDSATALIQRNVDENGSFKLPKNGRVREIALLPPVVEAMKSQFSITGNNRPKSIKVAMNEMNKYRTDGVRFVFPPTARLSRKGVSTIYTPNRRSKNWAAVVERAGVRYRRQYQTRHTFACWALTFNGNPVFVANQMGHRDFTEIVEVYGKWMPEETKFEVDKIWEFYTRKFPNSAPSKIKDRR